MEQDNNSPKKKQVPADSVIVLLGESSDDSDKGIGEDNKTTTIKMDESKTTKEETDKNNDNGPKTGEDVDKNETDEKMGSSANPPDRKRKVREADMESTTGNTGTDISLPVPEPATGLSNTTALTPQPLRSNTTYANSHRLFFPLPVDLPVLHYGSNLGPGIFKRFFKFHGIQHLPKSTGEGRKFINCFLRRLDLPGDILSLHSRSVTEYEDFATGIPNGMHLVRLDVYYIRHPDFPRRVFSCQVVQTFLLYAAGVAVLRVVMSEPKIHIMETATVSGFIHFGTRLIESPNDPTQIVVPCQIAVGMLCPNNSVFTYYPHP